MQNQFVCEGNVGGNFELKSITGKDKNSYKVLNFSLRCPVQTRQESGKYEDTGGFWVSKEFWGGLAEMTYKLMKTGARVFVVGQLSEEQYEVEAGPASKMCLRADSVSSSPLGIELIEYKPKANGGAGDDRN